MATSSQPRVENFEENQLSIKLSGNIQDIQITEEELEETDSEDDDDSSTARHNAMSTLPAMPIVKSPGAQPSFGSVQVTDSENVHFGDNITGDNIVFNFKGPVVIKQVVHPAEQDNPGYLQTEDDAPSNNVRQQKIETKDTTKIKTSRLKLWLKLSFSVVSIVIVGGICAVVSITLTYAGQETTTSASNDEQDASTECITVEGFPYGPLRLIMFLMLLVVFLFISCVKLLTKEIGDNDKDNRLCGGTAVPPDTPIPTPTTPVAEKVTEPIVKTRTYNIEADPLLIAPHHLRIVSRIDWLAQPVEKPLDRIKLPVPWVIITHTATEGCYSQSECILSVRLIQMFHVESRGWFDIAYNFLVAGDGSAYAGRGWEYQGAHTLGYNKYSMGIAFIGTFNNEPPPKKQLDACKKLIQRGVELGKIAKDYKLFAHRQLSSTLSPGDKLFEILKEWPHFVKNVTDIEKLLPDY